jgi:hypothetical protein
MFLNCSTCFGRHTAHHQELKYCNCSLWFYIRLWLPVGAAMAQPSQRQPAVHSLSSVPQTESRELKSPLSSELRPLSNIRVSNGKCWCSRFSRDSNNFIRVVTNDFCKLYLQFVSTEPIRLYIPLMVSLLRRSCVAYVVKGSWRPGRR